MKTWAWGLVLLPAAASASDHNNIDSGRPLRFEDAYSIGYGERVWEVGLDWSHRRLGGVAEFKHGFAINQEWGVSASLFEDGAAWEAGYLHGFQREIGNSPALALRLKAGVDLDNRGEGLVRLIATRTLTQYDKLHLNLEGEVLEGARPGYAATLGYSTPLGYPRRFDQTLVAELSWRREEGRWRSTAGIGLRRQVDPTSTFDIGVEVGQGARIRLGFAKSF